MKTTFISTASLWNSPRNAINKMQAELAKANAEVATGRYADVGLKLGYQTGQAITLRQEKAQLDALIDGNGLISLRLSGTKTVLDHIRGTAESFLSSLVSVPSLGNGTETVQTAAKENLGSLLSQLNQNAEGQYIFSGINTKKKPVAEYTDTPPSAPKLAVDTAFNAEFGISQTNPAVQSITAADMEAFLNGSFSSLFDDANWAATWSSASDQNIESRISTTEKVETSTNANETAFRKLAMAYTMAADLGNANLKPEVQQVITKKVIEILGSATKGIVDIQSDLGTAQKKVTDANERMGIQKDILTQEVGRLEEVDPAEAKTKVDALMTQIQMSYSLTAQLRDLSLFNYL